MLRFYDRPIINTVFFMYFYWVEERNTAYAIYGKWLRYIGVGNFKFFLVFGNYCFY